MKKIRFTALILALVMLGSAMAGCGSSNDGGSTDDKHKGDKNDDVTIGEITDTGEKEPPIPEPDPNASEGLEFALNEDGKSYKVVGIGTCTDNDLVIPAVHDGKWVTRIGEAAFNDCVNLVSVTIPDSVTEIEEDAFGWCENLTSITIPDSVTKIRDGMFYHCERLTSITIPDSVTEIEASAFGFCGLTSITIPDGVTNIGRSAFVGCAGLRSITLPNSVTSIGGNAFLACGLTSITYTGSMAEWEVIEKGDSWDDVNYSSYTVHCTDGDIAK